MFPEAGSAAPLEEEAVRPQQAFQLPWHQLLSEDALVETVFDRFARKALQQQQAISLGRARDSAARRSQRDTYLNPKMRSLCHSRARLHLQRLQARGGQELPLSTMYSMLVLQHLLELHVAPEPLPSSSERLHEDGVCTSGISKQFLVDATRCRYIIEDQYFHYTGGPTDEEAQRAFVQQLVSAVARVTPSALEARVTGLLCQSALACLEIATLCIAATSGGTEEVLHSLWRDPARPAERWLVKMQVHRHGFRDYVACISDGACDAICASDEGSSVLKSATVAIEADGLVDVVELVEQVSVVEAGQLVDLDTLCRPIVKAPQHRPAAAESLRRGRSLQKALSCLQGCWRRTKGHHTARQPELQTQEVPLVD